LLVRQFRLAPGLVHALPDGWAGRRHLISNNGIEWAAAYFIMLLVLVFVGAGKWASVD